MLLDGAHAGAEVHVWYAGPSSPELHIERVRAGGHDIPETTIRTRFNSSRANLIKLLPYLASLRVYRGLSLLKIARQRYPGRDAGWP